LPRQQSRGVFRSLFSRYTQSLLLVSLPQTVSQHATAFLADKAEAAVKGGVADNEKSLVVRRIVLCEGGIPVLEADNHANVMARVSTEQLPGPNVTISAPKWSAEAFPKPAM
jgi:hypothetical protein